MFDYRFAFKLILRGAGGGGSVFFLLNMSNLDERLFVCLTMESLLVVDCDVSTAILLVFIRR